MDMSAGKWTARRVTIDRVDDVFLVGLAEIDGETGAYLILQRADSFDEQDRRLGHDTYCIVAPGQGTTYGGVKMWSMAGDRLTIAFTQGAAVELGTAPVQDIKLAAAADLDRLESALRYVLEGDVLPAS